MREMLDCNAARYEFVTFLDADDRWRPHFIERMSNFLIAVPTVSAAFANFVRFNHSTGELLSDQFRLYPQELRNPFGHLPRDRAFTTWWPAARVDLHADHDVPALSSTGHAFRRWHWVMTATVALQNIPARRRRLSPTRC